MTSLEVQIQKHNRYRPESAQMGDVISIKPMNYPWSAQERNSYTIAVISLTESQVGAFTEPLWDLTTYIKYTPPTFEEFRLLIQVQLVETEIEKLEMWADYIEMLQEKSQYPTRLITKRRFSFPGVTKGQTLSVTDTWDKRLERYVLLTDKLEVMKPLTVEEMLGT